MNVTKILAAAFAASTIAGSALAADLPSRKAPMAVAPLPIMTWAGWYVGLNAGVTFGGSNTPAFAATDITGTAAGVLVAAGATAARPASNNGKLGFIGGGQIGWNWQSGALVAGLEADIAGIGNGSSSRTGVSFEPATATTSFVTVRNKLNYLGTLRGRLGYSVTPSFLLYLTGGLAYGGVSSSATVFQTIAGGAAVATGTSNNSGGGTRVGYIVGGGAEWMFAQNWSAKLEYSYYDLGSRTAFGVNLLPGGPISVFQSTTRTNGHLVRVGLNYHFWSAPSAVVAKY